jgi:ABC-type multidrug transport system fused ATPase/permease subunit
LLNLKGECTVITVAHRLSTVMGADLVVYIEEGRVLSTGTFSEVRSAVPNFDIQAKLMGL